MDKKKIIKNIKYWVLPEGFYNILAAMMRSILRCIFFMGTIEQRKILSHNRIFKDLHKGKRCFILGSGPSIKQQDLKLLKGEICISVSNFFVHPDFNLIRPMYHCIGAMHPPFTKQDYVRWFKVMEPSMTDTILFLGYSDRQIILDNNLFKNTKVCYLDFEDTRARLFNKGLDLSGCLPAVASVSIMALILAIYLDFREIYLLGIEHTSFRLDGNIEYRHFYEGKNANVVGKMPNPDDLELEFWVLVILWRQYKAIRSLAATKRIKIFNAAEGGLLDLFPRAKYGTLFV